MNLLFRFLEETTEDPAPFDWTTVIFIGLLLVFMVVMFIVPQRRNKKKAKEMMDSLAVGSKVTTIGGMVGEIIEIDPADGSVIIETGDASSKTRMKFIRNAIYSIAPTNNPAVNNSTQEEYNEIQPKK